MLISEPGIKVFSIRFDVQWLKDKAYHVPQEIQKDARLSREQKKYLIGIHTSHNNCANDPSSKDIEVLEAAYCTD